jgi:hypothetical protein
MKKNRSEKRIDESSGHKFIKNIGTTGITNYSDEIIEKVYCYSLTKMEKLYHQDFDENISVKEFYDATISGDGKLFIRKTREKDYYLYNVFYNGKNIGETRDADDVESIIREYEYNISGPLLKVKGYYIEHEYDSNGNLVEVLYDINYNPEVEKYYQEMRDTEYIDEFELQELRDEDEFRFLASQDGGA